MHRKSCLMADVDMNYSSHKSQYIACIFIQELIVIS